VSDAALRRKIALHRELPSPAIRRELRKRAGLTLRDVAEACGVSFQLISHYELGHREPRGENLKRYVRVLRVIREAASDRDGAVKEEEAAA
jgi:transcriptional regulator with XRE-family HTH domain